MKDKTETIVYKPLKWIEFAKRHPVVYNYSLDTLHQSISSPESLQRTIRRQLIRDINAHLEWLSQQNGQQSSFVYIDPTEEEYTKQKDKEISIYENRKKILGQYDLLLSENQPWENQSEAFKELYSKYAAFFEKIQTLGEIFKNEESLLSDTEKNLRTTNIRKEHAAIRKEGFFSNVKFHLNHSDDRLNENRIRSIAIAVQAPLGISIMVLGGIVLIPTIGTFLLYLPIALIALGAILTVAALVLSYLDQKESISAYQNLENLSVNLLKSKETHTSRLLETWKKIEATNVEPINLSLA